MILAILTILWFVALLASIAFIRETARMHAMICMFPEGYRWWVFPLFLTALAMFASLVLFRPF
jgi:hypothetical protein